MAEFITLSRIGGPSVLVNADEVSTVRQRPTANTVVTMGNGQDFEVTETFEEVASLLTGS